VKCGAATVRAAKDGIQMGESTHTSLRPNIGPGFRGILRLHPTELWTFGCTSCGYVELFVLDPGGTAFMEQNWAPVPPAAASPGPPPPPPPPA
jgi:hypothetical protein